MKPTQFEDINKILSRLTKELGNILCENLVGLYLTGSLTYGDFDPGNSDIDFLAVLHQPLSKRKLQEITAMHISIGKQYPKWHKRIEGSYITQAMLTNMNPPKEARPYFNAGKMWSFIYGNEWLLNLFVLHECGIALFGPKPKELIKPVDIEMVKQASRKDLLDEWQKKLTDSSAFESADYDSSHLQAYAILTLCRILYRVKNNDVASKKTASTWAKKTYDQPWKDLIEKAENWKHGDKLNLKEKIREFISFVIRKTGV